MVKPVKLVLLSLYPLLGCSRKTRPHCWKGRGMLPPSGCGYDVMTPPPPAVAVVLPGVGVVAGGAPGMHLERTI